jgi:hypothetical protein
MLHKKFFTKARSVSINWYQNGLSLVLLEFTVIKITFYEDFVAAFQIYSLFSERVAAGRAIAHFCHHRLRKFTAVFTSVSHRGAGDAAPCVGGLPPPPYLTQAATAVASQRVAEKAGMVAERQAIVSDGLPSLVYAIDAIVQIRTK